MGDDDSIPPGTVIGLRFDEEAVADDLAAWCDAVVERVPDPLRPERLVTTLWVPTADGPRAAHLGDWIVRDREGRFEPQTPARFAATHEPLP